MKKQASDRHIFLLIKYKIPLIILPIIVMFLSFDASTTSAHSPHDTISALDISPDYKEDKTLFIILNNKLLKSVDGGSNWKRITNGIDHKYKLNSIVFSPQYHFDQTLYVTSNGDGIYKSVDQGRTWGKVNKGLDSLNIASLTVHPNFPHENIIMAVGIKGGLYKSNDGGANWYNVISDTVKVITIAFFHNIRTGHVLVGDQKGILHLSIDGGEKWQQHDQIANCGAITSIAIPVSVNSEKTLLIGTEKRGIFKTVDGGASYIAVNNGFPGGQLNITDIAISPDYKTSSVIMATTWTDAVFRSDDGGNSWRKFNTGITKVKQADYFNCAHFTHLRISRDVKEDQTIFLAGFDGLFRSTDEGRTWIELETMYPGAVSGLSISPRFEKDSTIAVATDYDGAYMSDNLGVTWKSFSKGLNSPHLFDIKFSPGFSSDTTMFSIDSFNIYRETDENSWERFCIGRFCDLEALLVKILFRLRLHKMFSQDRNFPDTIAISPNYKNDGTIFIGTRYTGIFKSVDAGKKWSQVWNQNWSRAQSKVVGWITSIVLSSNYQFDNILYSAVRGKGIYKSDNGGKDWKPVNQGLTKLARESFVGPFSLFLALSPNYKIDKTVFVGTADGLFKTIDGGGKWKKLKKLASDGSGFISAISISPNFRNDKTLIASVRGEGLFKSTDGGSTFAEVGHDLKNNNHLFTLIEFSPNYSIDNTIFGAGEELFQSTDQGNTWDLIVRQKSSKL